jgi:hypothetical protein
MQALHRNLVAAAVVTCGIAAGYNVAVAAAQQTVSTELRMLMTRPGTDPVEPNPGPPPADFPTEVLPRGTVPVASGANRTYTVVVGTLADRTPGWRTELLSAVSAFGWVSQMPTPSGFVMGSTDAVSICKGSDFVDVSLSKAARGGTNVRASLSRDPRRICASRGGGSAMSFADVTFPVLEPPADSKMTSGGGGGSSDEWTSRGQLTSDLPLSALADHYRRQIIDAGWSEDGTPAFFDNAIVVRFKAPSKIGPPLPAMLIITSFDAPHKFDVFMRLTRPPDRTSHE